MLGSIVSFFAGWQVKLAVVLLVLISLYTYHRFQIKVAVNTAVTQMENQIAKENFKLKERSLDAKVELQNKFDKEQKDKDERIKSLNARVASLSRSLSERPSREESSRVSESTGTQESSRFMDASRLYRDDATVAIWFATRTEGLKIELQTCYASYDAAKKSLEDFKKANPSKT